MTIDIEKMRADLKAENRSFAIWFSIAMIFAVVLGALAVSLLACAFGTLCK
jgi:hypothetical protein